MVNAREKILCNSLKYGKFFCRFKAQKEEKLFYGVAKKGAGLHSRENFEGRRDNFSIQRDREAA